MPSFPVSLPRTRNQKRSGGRGNETGNEPTAPVQTWKRSGNGRKRERGVMETKRITDTGFVSSRSLASAFRKNRGKTRMAKIYVKTQPAEIAGNPERRGKTRNPGKPTMRKNPGKTRKGQNSAKPRKRERRKYQRIRIFGITHEATHPHLHPHHGRGNPCQLPPHRGALSASGSPHTPPAPPVHFLTIRERW